MGFDKIKFYGRKSFGFTQDFSRNMYLPNIMDYSRYADSIDPILGKPHFYCNSAGQIGHPALMTCSIGISDPYSLFQHLNNSFKSFLKFSNAALNLELCAVSSNPVMQGFNSIHDIICQTHEQVQLFFMKNIRFIRINT